MPRLNYPRLIPTRALSSVYGKIEQMLLCYPGSQGKVTMELVLERYGQLFREFSDRVKFVVMGHFEANSEEAKEAERAYESAMAASHLDPRHHLVFCHTPRAGGLDPNRYVIHSEYIQDPFVVMETEDGAPVLLEPIYHADSRDDYVAEQLAIHAGFLIQPIDVQMEGGNILIGDDYALIGRNVLVANPNHGRWADPENAERGLENYMKRILGLRYIIWVGEEKELDLGKFHSTGAQKQQPFFHLDHFLTLGGKSRAGDEVLLLGRIDIAEVRDKTEEDIPHLEAINASLLRVKAHLRGSGKEYPGPRFKVHRLDMGGKMEVDRDGKRVFVPYSCNNAHVEWYHGVSRIYLPAYAGMEAIQARAEAKLKRIGFRRIVFIYNEFDEYVRHGGSLHCLSSVLSRGKA